MGMSTGNNKGGVQSDINVTPLIDVLLVLLIIFLVVMPIMMKMETLEVPRKLNNEIEMPDPNASMLTVKVEKNGQITFNDGDKDQTIQAVDLAKTLRPKLEAMHQGTEKVVFVDFDEAVLWKDVVTTMDSIRSLAADVNHDEIKVALKVKEDQPGQPAPAP
jgi:biopolymer transport protein TolR